MTRPPVGAKVRLIHDVDRYPHFVAPVGAEGIVTHEDRYVYSVRILQHIAGAEDWDNEILWSIDAGEEPADDLELVEGLSSLAARRSELVRRIELAVQADDMGLAEELKGHIERLDSGADEERAYELASADCVLPLTRGEAEFLAGTCDYLADIDEGEHTDYDELRRMAILIRQTLAEEGSR